MKLLATALCAALVAVAPLGTHPACNVSYWTTFKGTDVFPTQDRGAYFYRTRHVAIDADGAPNAYHPQDTGLDPVAGSDRMGDYAYARSAPGKHASAAIVADSGGGNETRLGEISIRLAEALGAGGASPRTGPSQPMGELLYAVFPGSRANPPWPVTNDQLRQRADALLSKAGDWPAMDCLK